MIERDKERNGAALAIVLVAVLSAATVITVGCAGGASATGTTPDSTDGPATVAAVPDDAPPPPPPPPPPPRFETVTIPEGTRVTVAFDEALSSDTAAAGDAFTATVAAPVTLDGAVVVAEGARVVGAVVDAVPSKKIGGTARLDLAFEAMTVTGGERVAITAVFAAEGRRQTKKDAATIGGATAGGALLGNIIGDRKGKEADGTKIGAVVGAAVGTAIAATNENDPVVIEPGTVVELRLDAPVTFEREI